MTATSRRSPLVRRFAPSPRPRRALRPPHINLPRRSPIIGILTLPNDSPPPFNNASSAFPASYVKWVESGGGRVVPLPYDAPLPVLAATLKSINGALFTGGAADFFNPDGSLTTYATAAQLIFNESVAAAAAGETWPLWGTCLGHELTLMLASGADPALVTAGFDSENASWPLTPVQPAASSSRLWGTAPPDVWAAFTGQPIAMNSHQAGVTPAAFAASAPLSSRFRVLTTNLDRKGKAFVSSTEGVTLPIYTTQFHPEKPLFEVQPTATDHSFASIVGNSYTQRFFVQQARANSRAFPTPAAEAAALIYNFAPAYTGPSGSEFAQVYYFA
jgi:gamma-glutamyl hydrolase